MAPAHRIIALFVTVALLPFLPAAALLLLLPIAALAVTFAGAGLRAAILRSVWRLRWLLAAVVVVYAFLSPGEGFHWLDAAARGALLVCAVTAVQLALYGVPAAALAEGLARVLRHERFAHRLVLTLDAVPDVQALIADTPAPATGGPLARLTARAAAVVEAVDSELGTRYSDLRP